MNKNHPQPRTTATAVAAATKVVGSSGKVLAGTQPIAPDAVQACREPAKRSDAQPLPAKGQQAASGASGDCPLQDSAEPPLGIRWAPSPPGPPSTAGGHGHLFSRVSLNRCEGVNTVTKCRESMKMMVVGSPKASGITTFEIASYLMVDPQYSCPCCCCCYRQQACYIADIVRIANM